MLVGRSRSREGRIGDGEIYPIGIVGCDAQEQFPIGILEVVLGLREHARQRVMTDEL